MTGKKRALGSDLKKVDRHVIQPHEYDEVPELTDEMAERADLYHGSKLIRRGWPKSDDSGKKAAAKTAPRGKAAGKRKAG
jgi:hypothetical protein